MEKTLKRLQSGLEFESASYKTKEFLSYARIFKNELKKELEKINASITAFNTGHFYVSGFFRINEKCYYFSQSDVRYNNFKDNASILVRTAKNEKDFSGGSNNYLTLKTDMFNGFSL